LFNGIYKIITVDNTFKQGKFEQTLDLIRLPVTKQDVNQLINARSRIETYVNYGLGQLGSLPYSRFTGPRILVNAVAAGTGIYNAGLGSSGGPSGLIAGIINQVVGSVVGSVTGSIINKATGAIADVFSGAAGRLSGAVLDAEFLRVSDLALTSGLDIVDNNELFNAIDTGNIPEEFLDLPEFEFDPDFGASLGDFAG
jgi:hypothetical protein